MNVSNVVNKIEKYILSIIFIIAGIALITGCGKKAVKENVVTYSVYFISDEYNSVTSKDYEIDEMLPSDTLERLMTIMSFSPEEDKMSAPFGKGSSVISAYIDDVTVKINMDDNYLNLDKSDEIMIREAVVKTFTQIPTVGYVQILVNGNVLMDDNGVEIGKMTADDFINSSNTYSENIMPEIDENITVYMLNKNRDSFIEVTREVHHSGNISTELETVLQLISGASDKDTYSPVNRNVKVNSIKLSERICYLDLSEDVLKFEKGVSEEITVYAFVNSLTKISYIDGVVLTVNGRSDILNNYSGVLYYNPNHN